MKPGEYDKKIDDLISRAIGRQRPTFDFDKWQAEHQKEIQTYKAQVKKPSDSVPSAGVWKTIIESRITKLAAVAVIIMGILIGVMHWPPSSTKPTTVTEKIPMELIRMPVKDLLDLHFGKLGTSFDGKTVAAALKQTLDKLSPRRTLAIWKYDKGQPERQVAAYHPSALSEIIEAGNLVVHARVEQVTFDVRDLKNAILEKNIRRCELFSSRIKATVELQVLEAYPSLSSLDGEKIVLSPVFKTDQLDVLEKGKEYLIVLKKYDDIVWMLPYNEGVYPLDPNTNMVGGFRGDPILLDVAWEFIMDLYDAIHECRQPSDKILDYWLSRLKSDDLTNSWTTVEYFTTLGKPPVGPEVVADAIERHYTTLERNYRLLMTKSERESTLGKKDLEKLRRDVYQGTEFLKEALGLLIRVADEPTAKRILVLYEQGKSDPKSVFNGDSAREFSSKIACLVPKGPESELSTDRMDDRISMSRKEKIQEAVRQFREGKTSMSSVVDLMIDLLEAEDTEFIPFLREAVKSDWIVPILIAEVLPDPCFVPVLKEVLEKKVAGGLLQALFACGEEKEAIECALTYIPESFNKEDRQMINPDFLYGLLSVIKFLGTAGDESVIPVVEKFTREDVIQPYREAYERYGLGEFVAQNLQTNAILALARLGPESAILRVKELYASTDTDMSVRIAAALSLYYLGDDTGYEYLEHFVNHTERSVPEIEIQWGRTWGSSDEVFQKPLLYLRSHRTDALLLESLRHSYFRPEGSYTGDDRRYYAYAFAKEYQKQILPILVDRLSSRDRTTRKYANKLLERLTAQDFGFQAEKFVCQQEKAIGRWREYINDYLADNINSIE